MPRGLALGALADEGLGCADTTRQSDGVSPSTQRPKTRLWPGQMNPVAHGSYKHRHRSLIDLRHGHLCERNEGSMNDTWSIQRCWIDRARAIYYASPQAIH